MYASRTFKVYVMRIAPNNGMQPTLRRMWLRQIQAISRLARLKLPLGAVSSVLDVL